MSTWAEVRSQAQQRHLELAGPCDDLVPAPLLLAAAADKTRIDRIARPPDDALLDGAEASYDQERSCIYYSNATEPALADFHVAHEFAHHWMNIATSSCRGFDLDPSTPAVPAMSLVGDPDSYSPKERTEAQANVFAREFLVPRDKIRRRYAKAQFDAEAVAIELMVPIDLVMQQMADALLLPAEKASASQPNEERAPDDGQKEAITAPDGPRQVRAGPGSGKTRTLVGRVSHLVSTGATPDSILALTYSNLSAQDLANRIRRAIGEKATAVWSGTFHAYGLELLRKHGSAIGLPTELKPLDRASCLLLLEQILPKLHLNYYLDLREPLLQLRWILGAIGRAKDELVTPEQYLRLAEAMRVRACDEKTKEAADRACEAARVYSAYEETLRNRGQVDFGDLIARSVELLRAHPEIRDTVRAARPHVLVDEYQDMNRASGIFLKELVQPGRGPWVVGDVRQAIYRFRGASPLNMSQFAVDFPGAQVTDLTGNYRSGGRIVRTFETFGHQMTAGLLSPQKAMTAHRGEACGTVTCEIASTREAEGNGIAQSILRQVAAGDRFGNHTVLGHSHAILARLAGLLERAGVPCLYFGDFFERPEIRDLLSVVSLVSEREGVGLLRVAQFPWYAVSPDDIAVVFAWRREQKVSMLSAINKIDQIDGLSESGLAGLKTLQKDLMGVDRPMSSHRLLMVLLFRRCNHLTALLKDESVLGQQRRLAVYQLLLFSFTFKPPVDGDPKREFLKHIRRLEVLDETKDLRQLPAEAADIDAVRLMTIHASKGLEFPHVYIPMLTSRHFPAQGRYEWCPPPEGMISSDALMSRDAEEESLFFVAVSRAKDGLAFSWPIKAGEGSWSKMKPSPFLQAIERHLSRSVDGVAGWTDDGLPLSPHPVLAGRPVEADWNVWAIETYLECPRKYYYAEVLDLDDCEASSYLKFQSAFRATIGWLRGIPPAEQNTAELAVRFEEDWNRLGPKGDPLEPLLRTTAERMLQSAMRVMDGQSLGLEFGLKLAGSGTVVKCKADHVKLTSNGVVIQRYKGSRLAKKETSKVRYALQQAAARQAHPSANVTFEHVSLMTGGQQDGTVNAKKMDQELAEIEKALKDIAAGVFDPTPHDWCPNCPFFFVCPSHGASK